MDYVDPQTFGRPPAHPSISLPGPGRPEDTTKRRLLLIYIHGFQGSETSFQELPSHVHDLVSNLLSESHLVYTRIYPRYKSQGELQTAVDQFSAWLAPHEADDLDVILLGHSIGGILAADVALLQKGTNPKHRILGLINYDTPFLGLHPRIIPAGIKSMFPMEDAPPEENIAEEQESLGMEPAYRPVAPGSKPSPNFNRPWRNDKRQPDRGLIGGVKHFINKKKNEDNFAKSVFERIISPARFANCVNNYSDLRRRYQRLKELEKAEFSAGRIRFINYYTSSTGRRQRKKSEKSEENDATKTATTPPLLEFRQRSNGTEGAEESMSSLSLADSSSTSVDQTDATLSETVSHSTSESGSNTKSSKSKLLKPQKFILLPSYHWRSDDNANWTPVVMQDMDSVVAHQSMFLTTGKHYDYLFGDTVAIIEQWVQDDLTERMVQGNLQESID
ncbi:hypothetical protein N7488_011066 [Penicillium malachiteum]|nr:hypothetical protein N7488_011066 [Penicillium malachiteum]